MGQINRKQEKAIDALIANPEIGAAALAAGVGRSTLFRWLQDSDFAAAYRARRVNVWQQSAIVLQRGATAAAVVLRKIAVDDKAPATARVSACRAILEHARLATDLDDLAADVKTLMRERDARRGLTKL